MKAISLLLGSVVLLAASAPLSAIDSRLELAVDDAGACVGLHVGAALLDWRPELGSGSRLVENEARSSTAQAERVDRFSSDANGLRWKQTFRNLTEHPIAIGPSFEVHSSESSSWRTPGLPLEVRIFSKAGLGVTLLQAPNEAIWSNNRRLEPGASLTFTALIRAHAADWRPGMAALVAAYPEFMNPPNPRVHQVAGGGAYSAAENVPDIDRALKIGFQVNWKASFDFTGIGVFVAPSPVPVETTWTDIRGKTTSIAKMARYATAMKQAGFHVLNYFNVTEAGHEIQSRPPPRVAERDEDLWRRPNDWVHYAIRDAVLETEKRDLLYTDWEGCVVVDPAEPKYRAHLRDQATRLVHDIPDADGVCVDRMDHLGKLNRRRSDGLGMYPGSSGGARLLVSWMDVMDELGPIFHKAGKVMFGNPIRHYSLAAFQHLDGLYTEYWDELEACAMLCVIKPLIVWSGDYSDAGMQKLLHFGAWPTCPMPGNDHSQAPDPSIETMLQDYAPMFEALRGRRWALHANPIQCRSPQPARANLFVVPGGYVAVVTDLGAADSTVVQLPELPLPSGVEDLKAWQITPGQPWAPVALSRQGRDWLVSIPLRRGCGMVRLHWAWIEPFQRGWTVRPAIQLRTTVPNALFRATVDGTPAMADSPVWKPVENVPALLEVRTRVWKDGRQVGDELVANFVQAR